MQTIRTVTFCFSLASGLTAGTETTPIGPSLRTPHSECHLRSDSASDLRRTDTVTTGRRLATNPHREAEWKNEAVNEQRDIYQNEIE